MPWVEIHTVEVEEGGVDEEEHVDVARQQERDHEQGRWSEKLEGKCVHIRILLAQLGECIHFRYNITLSGQWPHSLYLVSPLVSDDGEGRGVVEDVVVPVLLPEGEVDVAEAVIEEFVKVRTCPDHHRRQQVLW